MADARKLGFGPIAAPAGGVLVVFGDDGLKFGPKTARGAGLRRRSGGARRRRAVHRQERQRARHRGAGRAQGGAADRDRDRQGRRAQAAGLRQARRHRAWGAFRRAATEATILLELADGALKPDAGRRRRARRELRAYAFDRYKTKRKEGEERPAKAQRDARGRRRRGARARPGRAREAVADGVVIARDLVNEPPNVLYPDEFARRAARAEEARRRRRGARREGDEEARHGRAARRRAGLGAARAASSSCAGTAARRATPPVAFIGKGVCFDTGGISIKPAAGMEDMKGDMAGAACVVGLMHALAGAQGQGQRGRRHRPRREHAGRQRAAAGRHRHLDVGPDHRDHQHRRRRPARARRRAALRQHAASSRSS